MRTKSILWSMMSVALTALSISFVACGGDDNDDSSSTPVSGVSGEDPAGTVVINMSRGSSGNYYDIGLKAKIHVDENNNFGTEEIKINETEPVPSGTYGYYCDYYVEFASVGNVNGLAQVSTIPTTGWAKSIVAIPGNGYIARMMYRRHDKNMGFQPGRYSRLYVVGQNTETGITVKYQTPFEVPSTQENRQ